MSRVTQTLEGFEGVERVEFIPSKDQFEVAYSGDAPMGEEFKKAVTGVIILPGVRKFLGSVGDRMHNSEGRSP